MEEISNRSQTTTDVQELEELRQRINDEAEKMLLCGKDDKSNWFFVIVCIALIAVSSILTFHFDMFGNIVLIYVFWGCIWILSEMLILRHYFRAMENADSASQHFRAARRFIKTMQWGCVFAVCGFIIIHNLIDAYDLAQFVFESSVYLVFLIVDLAFYPSFFIDKDFFEDVEELGEYE